MKKQAKKLRLAKETVRLLTRADLTQVAAGYTIGNTCYAGCTNNTTQTTAQCGSGDCSVTCDGCSGPSQRVICRR